MLFVATFHAEYIHELQKEKNNKEQALERLIGQHDPAAAKSSRKSNAATKGISNDLKATRRIQFIKKNNTVDFQPRV